MKQVSAVALLVFALVACKPATDANNAAATAPDAAAPTDIESLPPSEDVIPPATEDGAANEAATANAIPAAFHGRWSMVPADCTTARGDDKGLITIDSNGIKFYESRATLTKVTMNAPENFTGVFDFAGEGQTWTRTENYKLTDSSKTLVRDAEGVIKAKYKRCAA